MNGTDTFPVLERSELITPGPAQALAGLLDLDLAPIVTGTDLPLLWHWAYLLDRVAQHDLGIDGHPGVGGLPLPPEPGQRRMFAGGRVSWSGNLRVGIPATRTTSVAAVKETQGHVGPLTFVTVVHVVAQQGHTVVRDEQDIVYRPADTSQSKQSGAATSHRAERGPAATALADWSNGSVHTVNIDPVLLFRFSALTYNSHRIHYDRDYARDVEGYDGLVVHGPLQALLMATEAVNMLEVRPGEPAGLRFEYRLITPLLDRDGLTIEAAKVSGGVDVRARDDSGRVTAGGEFRSTH